MLEHGKKYKKQKSWKINLSLSFFFDCLFHKLTDFISVFTAFSGSSQDWKKKSGCMGLGNSPHLGALAAHWNHWGTMGEHFPCYENMYRCRKKKTEPKLLDWKCTYSCQQTFSLRNKCEDI